MSTANRVFVIDADSSARNGLARLFRVAGYDVQAFATAKEFLDNLEPQVCGCLVLDAGMPGALDEELLVELEARNVCLPLVFVSADDNPDTRREARKMKAVGFFRKPVDGAALLDFVKWALETDELSRA